MSNVKLMYMAALCIVSLFLASKAYSECVVLVSKTADFPENGSGRSGDYG